MSRQRPSSNTEDDTLQVPVVGPASFRGREEARGSNLSHAPVTDIDRRDSKKDQKDLKVKTATFLGMFGAIELENKGSVARDHLALERTFLAWLRTSLAFASIGIAVTQLFRLNAGPQPSDPTDAGPPLGPLGKSLGATFVGISIVILALGAQRYYESQGWLLKGKFPASRGSIFATALIAFLLIIASLIIVLVARPETTEL